MYQEVMRKQGIYSDLHTLLQDELRAGKSAWLKVQRRSMLPNLQPEDEIEVVAAKPAQLRQGDLVVYLRHQQLIVHRLLQVYPHGLLTKGDNQRFCDAPVNTSCLIGRVRHVRRGGKILSQPSTWWMNTKNRLAHLQACWGRQTWVKRMVETALLEIDLVGEKIQLLLPPKMLQQPFVQRLQRGWSSQSSFRSWLVACDMRTRKRLVPETKSNNYWLKLKTSEHGLQMRAQHFKGKMDWRSRQASLQSWGDPAGSLENFLRVLVAHALLRRQGFLLHAAAVVCEEKAIVFLGPSGSGKSTIAAISKSLNLQVLSDDLVAIVQEPSGFYAHGLPFKGSHPLAESNPGRYPIAGIYTLEKGATNQLQRWSRAAAMMHLMRSIPFLPDSSHIVESLMTLLGKLHAQQPLQQLTFTPDATLWDLI